MPQRPIPPTDIVGGGFDGVMDVSERRFAGRGEGAVGRAVLIVQRCVSRRQHDIGQLPAQRAGQRAPRAMRVAGV